MADCLVCGRVMDPPAPGDIHIECWRRLDSGLRVEFWRDTGFAARPASPEMAARLRQAGQASGESNNCEQDEGA
jgi:hypothetical protein